MSYVPFREGRPDNPDFVGLPEDAYDRLVPLGDLIEASHLEGYHQSECGCAEPTCWTRENHGRPSTEEVLGWLVAKGLLNLDDVDHLVRKSKGWSIGRAPGNLGGDVATVLRVVLTERHSANSFIGRHTGLRYKRIEDCLGVLETWNILGPAHGSQARAILVDADQTDAVLKALDNAQAVRA